MLGLIAVLISIIDTILKQGTFRVTDTNIGPIIFMIILGPISLILVVSISLYFYLEYDVSEFFKRFKK